MGANKTKKPARRQYLAGGAKNFLIITHAQMFLAVTAICAPLCTLNANTRAT
jgi:hypothetical protein